MTDAKPPVPPTKSTGLATTNNNTTLDQKRTGAGVKLPGLHARLRQPLTQDGKFVDPLTKSNRLALMLDVSGSMGGNKIESLRQATSGFVAACDFSDTSLAFEPFGDEYPSSNRVALTCIQPMLLTTSQMLNAVGGTPMAQAMNYVIENYSLTRAVLLSDGQPDSEAAAYASAERYREARIPVDCVHIGDSSHGEPCLRRIAEMTGGQFIKFTDLQSFSKNFKYLTPKYYAMLTTGGVTASDLGAKELK